MGAMDAARTALRLGAEESWIVYRRSKVEMPARAGRKLVRKKRVCVLNFLTSPTRIICNDDYWVTAMECLQYELGEPDEPAPQAGSH